MPRLDDFERAFIEELAKSAAQYDDYVAPTPPVSGTRIEAPVRAPVRSALLGALLASPPAAPVKQPESPAPPPAQAAQEQAPAPAPPAAPPLAGSPPPAAPPKGGSAPPIALPPVTPTEGAPPQMAASASPREMPPPSEKPAPAPSAGAPPVGKYNASQIFYAGYNKDFVRNARAHVETGGRPDPGVLNRSHGSGAGELQVLKPTLYGYAAQDPAGFQKQFGKTPEEIRGMSDGAYQQWFAKTNTEQPYALSNYYNDKWDAEVRGAIAKNHIPTRAQNAYAMAYGYVGPESALQFIRGGRPNVPGENPGPNGQPAFNVPIPRYLRLAQRHAQKFTGKNYWEQ